MIAWWKDNQIMFIYNRKRPSYDHFRGEKKQKVIHTSHYALLAASDVAFEKRKYNRQAIQDHNFTYARLWTMSIFNDWILWILKSWMECWDFLLNVDWQYVYLGMFVCSEFCGSGNMIKVKSSPSVDLLTLFLGRLRSPQSLTSTYYLSYLNQR